MRSDDLVPLLKPDAGKPVGFRQGVVVSWDQETAENTILVGGSLMENLPILNTSEAAILAEGNVVSILTAGSTWGILGRFTIPGTAEAVSALSAIKVQSDSVNTPEATTSGSFTDLATPGPEVVATIGPTGRAVLILSAQITLTVPTGGGITSVQAQMSFIGTGANVFPTGTYQSMAGQLWYNSSQSGGFDTSIETKTHMSKTFLLEGLSPGSTTFTAKYRRASGAGTLSFDDRNMTVLPL